ncbi:MAG TPA: outer membrane beta-barrel protein [Devosia sp.]|nr:outer membrane beta-barrel protein [Devosia sp.]
MSVLRSILVASTAIIALATTYSHAADLGIEEPPMVEEAPAGDWAGPYIGIFGGTAWGFADDDASQGGFGVPAQYPDGLDIDLAGWEVGVKAGANFYLADKVVGGVVGDFAWSNITGAWDEPINIFDYTGTTHTIDWQGSARVILGYDAGAFLPYVTGGLAFAHANRHSPFPAAPGSDASATHVGYTIGAGASVAISDNAALNVEYRYSNFGAATYDWAPPAATDRVVTLTTHAITAGIEWSF